MDSADVFWENIKKEIKQQNTTHEWVAKKAKINFSTFQGWISKGIFPRANEAVRIAAVLNTSVEYLVTGTMREWENTASIKTISYEISQIYKHLGVIVDAIGAL
jgi:predicted transcriptional regulator